MKKEKSGQLRRSISLGSRGIDPARLVSNLNFFPVGFFERASVPVRETPKFADISSKSGVLRDFKCAGPRSARKHFDFFLQAKSSEDPRNSASRFTLNKAELFPKTPHKKTKTQIEKSHLRQQSLEVSESRQRKSITSALIDSAFFATKSAHKNADTLRAFLRS